MNVATGDPYFKDLAQKLVERMDNALHGVEGLHHDVGFQWLFTAVADYKLTGSGQSRIRGLTAANFLASRFNIAGGYITAWNSIEKAGWTIIDTMMNIPLLYWATEETGYERYKFIAMAHADKAMNTHVRPDGSVNHIVSQNERTGEVIETFGGQGYGVGSSWSRGQAWAVYGFIQSYIHTGEQRYLDTAKKTAHYFISAVADTDYITLVDFRSPAEPVYVDTTAGAITACGLIEIAKNVPEYESKMYLNAAVRVLMALEEKYADWSENCDAILRMGSEAYHFKQHMDIIYGDYYFIEAIFKLNGIYIVG